MAAVLGRDPGGCRAVMRYGICVTGISFSCPASGRGPRPLLGRDLAGRGPRPRSGRAKVEDLRRGRAGEQLACPRPLQAPLLEQRADASLALSWRRPSAAIQLVPGGHGGLFAQSGVGRARGRRRAVVAVSGRRARGVRVVLELAGVPGVGSCLRRGSGRGCGPGRRASLAGLADGTAAARAVLGLQLACLQLSSSGPARGERPHQRQRHRPG